MPEHVCICGNALYAWQKACCPACYDLIEAGNGVFPNAELPLRERGRISPVILAASPSNCRICPNLRANGECSLLKSVQPDCNFYKKLVRQHKEKRKP